jgi:serine/threonine-protein kinase SRPK3
MCSIDPSFFDDEGNLDYNIGGYCPIRLGDKLHNRYTVVNKLGWGHYSTVWLCIDHNVNPTSMKKYVALKIVKSSPNYTRGFCDYCEKHILVS